MILTDQTSACKNVKQSLTYNIIAKPLSVFHEVEAALLIQEIRR
jgi:hypothetical protein